ncbi:MAG: hypothetical protein H7Y43_13065 [Akkermansiaceae bacterium]|nr:hypothetical protein [Verrucomicrobiales bacterium]
MIKILTKRLGLAWLGLVLGGGASIASAQNWTFTFDTDISGGGSVGWVQWWIPNNGSGPVTTRTWDGTHDAVSNVLSGSLKIESTWPPGTPGGEQYYPTWTGWRNSTNTTSGEWDTGITVQMDNYTNVSFDVFVDPSSTTLNTNGNFGTLQVMMNVGWSQVVIGSAFTIPANATNGWHHFSVAIPKGKGGAWGPGFFRRNIEGVEGTEAIYIDNLYFAAAPPEIAVSFPPQSQQVWAGQTINIPVINSGLAPFSYQWHRGGAPLNDGGNISGATSASLMISNASVTDVNFYQLVITNASSAWTSSIVNVQVIAGPGDAHAIQTKAIAPVAFFELNETNNPATGASAFDRLGRFSGWYEDTTVSNAFHGIVGPRPTDGYTNLLANNAAAQFPGNNGTITIPPLNLNTASATFTAWINPAVSNQVGATGIIFCRASSGGGSGLGYNFNTTDLGYTWNNDTGTWNWLSGVQPPINVWSFVVLVVTPTDATIYCFSTNTGYAAPQVGSFAHNHGPAQFDAPTLIGQDSSDVTRNFNGRIDNVGIYNRALTYGEIIELYVSATGDQVAPEFNQQPVSTTRFLGSPAPAVFSATAFGSATLGYQWQKVAGTLGGNAYGVNTPTLTLSNLTLADVGSYRLVVTNGAGSTNSDVVSFGFISPVGTYASTVVSQNPVAFYELNELQDPAIGGVLAIDDWGGRAGTYGTLVQNGLHGISGPLSTNGFIGFTPTNTAALIAGGGNFNANSVVTIPPLGINTATITMTAWINPTFTPPGASAVLMQRGGGANATGMQFNGDEIDGSRMLGYSWNDQADSYNWSSGVYPPVGEWSFVALVVTPTNATMNIYTTNRVQRAVNTINHPALSFDNVMRIGVDSCCGDRTFNGIVDDVAIFNHALTQAELDNLADIGGAGPVILRLQGLQLNWLRGTLVEATNIAGPWTPSGSSPLTITPTGPAKFYRVGVPTP